METMSSLLGLNNYEMRAYETLTKIGKSTATKISQKSGVPQGKIYLVLDSLIKKGLVDSIPKEPREFISNNPDLLLDLLDKKNQEIEQVKNKIKQLRGLYNEEKEIEESKILVRQGKKAFYNILENLEEAKYYDYTIKLTSEFDKERADKQKKKIKEGLDVKVLAKYTTEEDKRNIQKWLKIHDNIKIFENEGVAMSIQDDKDVMIVLPGCNATILIRDFAFSKIMKNLFLQSYNQSKLIKEMGIKSKKEQIFSILRKTINSFNKREDYKFIGIIGSFSNLRVNSSDLDLVTIGDNQTHEIFKEHLLKAFKDEGIDVLFFKTIKREFLCPKKGVLLIHDIHHENLSELLNREWKTVINTIKYNSLKLYGEDIKEKITSQKIDKNAFFSGLLDWANEIEQIENYLFLEKHLINIKPVFIKYGFESDFNKISLIIDSEKNWKGKLIDLKNIMKLE